MSRSPTKVLVLGATGIQGTAVIKSLVSSSTSSNRITIHALVRDPSSSASTTLQSLSTPHATIKLCTGTFDDQSSLEAAASDCNCAFLNFKPSMNPPNPEIELTHARNALAALASTPSIKRVVYTSIANLLDPTDPASYKGLTEGFWMYNLFKSKWEIQEMLKAQAAKSGWSYTILGLGTFLSNFLPPILNFAYPELTKPGKKEIVVAFPPGHQQCYVDMQDVGNFATGMLMASDEEMREKWNGRILNFASENCAFEDVIGAINEVLGMKGEDAIGVKFMGREEAEEKAKTNVLTQSQLALADNKMVVDMGVLRAYGIEMGGVKAFFERNKEKLKEVIVV
jgi:nucleoside-diphosphate-sugar epimerase